MGILKRSTLLRHTLIAGVGIAVLWGLLQILPAYRAAIDVSPIAYTVCAAAGLTLLVGLSGQISLGHGAFMAVGAYTLALLQEKWTNPSHQNLQLIVLLAACVAVTAVFGAVVGLAAARLRGPYLAGATLALALGLPSLASMQRFGLEQRLGGNSGLVVNAPSPPPAVQTDRWQAFICCVCAVLALWVVANVSRSRVGRSMRAVRDDEVAAALSGLSVPRVQVLAFVISAACAGLGGALLGMINSAVGPGSFDLTLSLSLLAAVVFGGLGSIAGAIYGSVLVVLLPTWSHDITRALSIHSAQISNNMPSLIYGIVLAAAMLAAPNGVQGLVRRLRPTPAGRRR